MKKNASIYEQHVLEFVFVILFCSMTVYTVFWTSCALVSSCLLGEGSGNVAGGNATFCNCAVEIEAIGAPILFVLLMRGKGGSRAKGGEGVLRGGRVVKGPVNK